MSHYKTVIIGSGPAGYSAGIYAARGGAKPLIITGNEFGGSITRTNDLENYPGFSNRIDGIFLTEEMRKQAEIFGTEIKADSVIRADLSGRPFTLELSGGDIVTADSLIIATGSEARTLGLENEKRLTGHGISYCATCDGFFFKGRPVAVIGGGNSAATETLHLSETSSHVYIIHRRGELRAEQQVKDYIGKAENITMLMNSTVEEVMEKDGNVSAIRIKNTITGEENEVSVDAIFIAVGSIPNSSLFDLEKDDQGYIATKPDSMKTSVEGVFAAGDIRVLRYRQAIIAAASGAQAAMEALEFLTRH